MTHTHTLIVLDPSSDWGEAALEHVIGSTSGHQSALTLFAPLNGPASFALSAYATAAGVSVAEAGDVYVEQVGDRVASRGVAVMGHATGDGDLAASIVAAAVASGATAIAIPAGDRIVDEGHLAHLASASGISIMVVPVGRKSAA